MFKVPNLNKGTTFAFCIPSTQLFSNDSAEKLQISALIAAMKPFQMRSQKIPHTDADYLILYPSRRKYTFDSVISYPFHCIPQKNDQAGSYPAS